MHSGGQVPMHASRTDYDYRVTATDLNRYGFMHGGRLLTLADEVAYMAARQHAPGDYLTLAVHRARFHRPAQLGQILRCRAQVAMTGKSSLWVPVDVDDGEGGRIMEAVFVFVAVGKDMRPRRVPAVVAVSEAERKLQASMQALHAQTRHGRCET